MPRIARDRREPGLRSRTRKRQWQLMTLFAGPIALYPRGCGQLESRVHRGSFISANGSASHRISVIDALVRPKERARRVVINPALTTALLGRHLSRAQS